MKFINPFNSRGMLVIKKFSPEILTGIGIVSGIVATITACHATTKLEDVLDKHDAAVEKLDEDDVKGKALVKFEAAKDVIRLYSPAVGFTALSVTSILGAHGIMSKRNAALAAAYSFASGKLMEYRQRVIEELGEDADHKFLHGLKTETVEITEEGKNGKTKSKKLTVISGDKSIYARFFDDASHRWENDPQLNLAFLNAQQCYANDLLRARGHVFLNEVYDILGIPRSREGAIVGWIYDPNGDGDNHIDFGIYSIENQEARDFVNGYNPAIFLDFNVDGVIYDLI